MVMISLLASIVQAVKLALAAEQALVSAVEMPVSHAAVLGVVEPSLVLWCTWAFQRRIWAHKLHLFLPPGQATVQLSQGRPAFVIPSFVPTF